MTDWQARFRARTVAWTIPAADDRTKALAASNKSGVTQLYTWNVSTNELTQLTDRPTGTTAGTISSDGRWVHYVDDAAGDELGHWLRVPSGGGEPVDLTPDMARYGSYDLRTSPDGRLIAFTAVAGNKHTVHLMPDPASRSTGAPRVLYQTAQTAYLIGFDADGRLLGVLTTERTSLARFSLVVFDVATGQRVAELWDGEESSILSAQFSSIAGDSRVVAVSDVTGASRPLIWDPRTNERHDLDLGDWGAIEGDISAFDWSPDGSAILLNRVANAVQQLAVYEPQTGSLRELDHPGGVYGFFGEVGNWFTNENDIVVAWQDASHASTIALLDGQTGRLKKELLPPEPLPPASRPWRSIRYDGARGDSIQAWVAVPEGEPPFPAIVETHGGPESVAMEQFAPRAQAWLDNGYAFLSLNYHGSTTFGRQFKESIWGHPGDLEVGDIVRGREWLVQHGIARPDEIFLSGWSYGGYLTLHGLGTAPGLWAGGLAGIAVADWVSEYEDENDSLRAYDRALFFGPPSEKMDAYVKASPLTYCEKVDAPVLIIQGRNDTRCPARQVELYETRMRELGKPIEVIWFDAGHAAGADIERVIGHVGAMLEFAGKILKEKRAVPA